MLICYCVYTQIKLLNITESIHHIIGDEGKVQKVRSQIYNHEEKREKSKWLNMAVWENFSRKRTMGHVRRPTSELLCS